tara:strand:+ start:1418 stop:1606 length:189 start_codon:yes stop_codon:yes gene_type:complete
MKKKVKYVKSLVIASLVVSLASVVFGIHKVVNGEYLIGLAFLFGGITIGWNDWSNLFKRNKS